MSLREMNLDETVSSSSSTESRVDYPLIRSEYKRV